MYLVKLNDFNGFKNVLDASKNIVALTGAGASAESGIPVFRGQGGIWKTRNTTEMASLGAFRRNPSLVWEYYQYRRSIVFKAQPNKAHYALAKYEEECRGKRQFHIITQNIDGLHQRAGSQNVIELHGTLSKVRCMNAECKLIQENTNNPICEALRDRGDPSLAETKLPAVDVAQLPKCKNCNTLVRPYVVWLGENVDNDLLTKAKELVEKCDLCLVIGSSLKIYPAAQFAPMVADAGKPVAEFNINEEPTKDNFHFHFCGPAGITLPKALGYEDWL